MLGAMRNWIYDRDPVEALRFEEPLRQLKEEDFSTYFPALLKKYFLENTHQVVVEMVPDATIEEKQVEAEKASLSKIKGEMSEADLKIVADEMAELQRRQAQCRNHV